MEGGRTSLALNLAGPPEIVNGVPDLGYLSLTTVRPNLRAPHAAPIPSRQNIRSTRLYRTTTSTRRPRVKRGYNCTYRSPRGVCFDGLARAMDPDRRLAHRTALCPSDGSACLVSA